VERGGYDGAGLRFDRLLLSKIQADAFRKNDDGDQVTSFNHSNDKIKTAVAIDLAGNRPRAQLWAESALAGFRIQVIDKTDLKWESKREALRRVRALKPRAFAVFSSDLATQSASRLMILFGAMAGARKIIIGDGRGSITRSRLNAFLIEAPLLALELVFGYAVLIPLSLIATALVSALIPLRNLARRMEGKPARAQTAFYLQATPIATPAGGQATHVAGFQGGALACGRRLIFISTTETGIDSQKSEAHFIEPSSAVSATRALFELWNNLRFTLAALQIVREKSGEADFIYQRYNRFNWSGVVLSIAAGLPLALEYNGSEVWISRNWNPVGHLHLLERFERLNLKAADSIFVVSEVGRNNLIDTGVDKEKIVVNPNGVDADEFRPLCGGEEVRRALGLEDKIVTGFVGTFGPWHGATVLAEAATLVRDERCHFLFIGDGDERQMCEAIIKEAKADRRATFAGRVAHSQVASYLDACDILASPHAPSKDGSRFFGSPTKLFEYMAMARPVVASRLGQIEDVIEDGETGLLVEPRNAERLARAIERLASDSELRNRLGRAARLAVINRYTWKQNAARVFDKVEEGM
jgi:glycosyltransferase involved in cell wall biosynthesis